MLAVLILLACVTAPATAHAAAGGSGLPRVVAAGPVQCQKIDPRTGLCLIDLLAPGASGSASNAGNSTSRASSTPQTCHSAVTDQDVPCAGSHGTWSNARSCYVQPSAEDPLPGSLLYEGHTDGAVYTCWPELADALAEAAYSFWAAAPPAAPDPEQLAQQAIQALGLVAVRIGIVPRPGADSLGLVGLPVWMWVEQPSATTFGPASQSASAGGITVTATAHVEHVTWSMGDGTNVTCTGPGTPYTDADGASSSPDCGHTYTTTSAGQPSDAYSVTATSHWVIDWAGGGATGQQTLDLTATTSIRIGETQAIVTSDT